MSRDGDGNRADVDLSRCCGDLFVIVSRMAETIRENQSTIQQSDNDHFMNHHPAEKVASDAWFETLYGDYIVNAEAELLKLWLKQLFGYRMVLLGARLPVWDACTREGHIRQRIWINRTHAQDQMRCDILSSMSALPVHSDCVDLVILFHALDSAEDPRRLIREVERILIPEGRVIILGFNPYSLLGVWRMLGRRHSSKEMGAHLKVGCRQLNEWLSLLGMEIEEKNYFSFRPPVQKQATLEKMAFMEAAGQKLWPSSGGVYAIQAVKKVATLTPFRPSFQWYRRFSTNGVAAPTTRGMHDDS
jgi:SAM-dependent methyltransferase